MTKVETHISLGIDENGEVEQAFQSIADAREAVENDRWVVDYIPDVPLMATEFTGTVVMDKGPVMLDDGTDQITVDVTHEPKTEIKLGVRMTARGLLNDGKMLNAEIEQAADTGEEADQ